MINKEWYKSKTVWATVFTAVVAVISSMYGETASITATVIAIGSAFGLYGRLTANTELK